jgi:hypothetical protein
MSMRIALAVLMAVLVAAAPAAHNRNDGFTSKLAQYCLPQDEVPGEQTIYCRGVTQWN